MKKGVQVTALQRRQEILKALRQNGGVSVAELAGALGVSTVTVRRDLLALQQQQQLDRTYGGAVPTGAVGYEPPFAERIGELGAEKAAIARLAASLVRPGDVIAIDSGTTLSEMVAHLRDKAPLTIITTALNVAFKLADCEDITVILSGGIVRGRTLSVAGPPAENGLAGYHANRAFIGCSALSLTEGSMNSNLLAVGAKRALAAVADEVIVLADHSKIGRTALASVVPVDRMHTLVTDWHTPPEQIQSLSERGVNVLVAPDPAIATP